MTQNEEKFIELIQEARNSPKTMGIIIAMLARLAAGENIESVAARYGLEITATGKFVPAQAFKQSRHIHHFTGVAVVFFVLDFGDQMATQDIKRSSKFHHDSIRQIRKAVAIQYLFAFFNTVEYSKNAIGKDEVASSNLASSSKRTSNPQGFGVLFLLYYFELATSSILIKRS